MLTGKKTSDGVSESSKSNDDKATVQQKMTLFVLLVKKLACDVMHFARFRFDLDKLRKAIVGTRHF